MHHVYASRFTSSSVLNLHHYPYDDHLISLNSYPSSLNTDANLSLIHSFTMVEYTNREYTDMVSRSAKLQAMGVLFGFIKSVIHIMWLYRIACSPKLFNGSRKEVPHRQQGWLWCSKEASNSQLWKGRTASRWRDLVNEHTNQCAWNECAL